MSGNQNGHERIEERWEEEKRTADGRGGGRKTEGVRLFGIRHLSPAGAWHLRTFLDQTEPELVLIEGPSDFTELIEEIADSRVKPPVAVMAYTKEVPIRTILYPFAVYSPEYQAVLWARENGKQARFIDLPSSVFLALSDTDTDEEEDASVSGVYEELELAAGEGGSEDFWEHVLEHAGTAEGYRKGAAAFGAELRRREEESRQRSGVSGRQEETFLRERYMLREIQRAVQSGIPENRIVAVTGAFHIEGLAQGEPMTKEELESLPSCGSCMTLMPYSYYRLSERSGYGAGNRAPAYYELLWDGRKRGRGDYSAIRYLARLAAFQRREGDAVSAAEVIEALRLAGALAQLHGYENPSLRDLKDAAVACMGHGRLGELAVAMADTEIGAGIGSLPKGVSQTSIQADFNRRLEALKLERFRSVTAQELRLDLREKLTVKSEKSAFLDLNRSFFLHRLRTLGISFAVLKQSGQTGATWAEDWVLRWTPEAEIQLVESVLKGDTVEQAASFSLKNRADRAGGIGELSELIGEAFLCGMPEAVSYVVSALQAMAVDAASADELAEAAKRLSPVIQYGDIRKLDREPLIPVLKQIFLRLCLVLPQECRCGEEASGQVAGAVDAARKAAAAHDFLDWERFNRTLREIADRDDLNTKLSGFAAAILLEEGEMGEEELAGEVSRRLSKGIPADLGAGWFEGLSMRNRYALIARLPLWESLSGYLDTLDDGEFKRALVFLRRAFADFTSEEKNRIAENLGEIWQVNPVQASAILNETLTKEEQQELLEGLGDFDFDDI